MPSSILARVVLTLLVTLVSLTPAAAQTFATDDPVLRGIWSEGMERSQTWELAQALMDSVGPRLTGTPGHEAGNQWLLDTYERFGIPARTEQYGTWMRWRRGRTHVDLVEPRVRSLDATTLAWTPGTGGTVVRGGVVALPPMTSPADFEAWLPSVEGHFVGLSIPEPTCRPDEFWQRLAAPESYAELLERREATREAWNENLIRGGFDPRGMRTLFPLAQRLEQAGAVGILTSQWSDGWGVHRVFNGGTERVPTLGLACEEYGLVHRLAEEDQGPILEVMSDNEFLGEGPVFNVIAELPGSERPEEYVVLSAHFDSWDGGSGATDNGTGTVTMLEAMRILKQVYPNPRRTILVGHWGGEEQGLNGSRGFAADNPQVVDGLQALFNQDNGTFRVSTMNSSGFTAASANVASWLSRIPTEISRHIDLTFPGSPPGGGSDHASFVCYGAPAFGLSSARGDYSSYTWHTNRDTFDKLVFPELRTNAVLTAMLAYLASEDPEFTPRDRRTEFGRNPFTGAPTTWPECEASQRSYDQRTR